MTMQKKVMTKKGSSGFWSGKVHPPPEKILAAPMKQEVTKSEINHILLEFAPSFTIYNLLRNYPLMEFLIVYSFFVSEDVFIVISVIKVKIRNKMKVYCCCCCCCCCHHRRRCC